MEDYRLLFLFIHIVPIFLEIIGIVPTLYFFVKIKSTYYRLFLIVKYCVILFFMVLSIKELEIIFLNGALLGHEAARIGLWEICGVLLLFCFIIGDIFVYYFYSHTKIIVSDSKGKFFRLVAFLAKDPKIYRSTLKFIGFGMLCFIIIMELILKSDSSILSLIREYLTNK